MSITVGLVEDNRETRERLVQLLAGAPEISVVAACATADEAVRQLPALSPRVVLLDILLGGGPSGVECVRRLRPLLPDADFLILTVVDDPDQIFDAIVAGATGYLLKTTPAAEIIDAVREIPAGGAPITTSIARKVLLAFRRFGRRPEAAASLSVREARVLEALAKGGSYKEIAQNLGVSAHTVRTHAHNIYRKLQVGSRQEAVSKTQPVWRPSHESSPPPS